MFQRQGWKSVLDTHEPWPAELLHLKTQLSTQIVLLLLCFVWNCAVRSLPSCWGFIAHAFLFLWVTKSTGRVNRCERGRDCKSFPCWAMAAKIWGHKSNNNLFLKRVRLVSYCSDYYLISHLFIYLIQSTCHISGSKCVMATDSWECVFC